MPFLKPCYSSVRVLSFWPLTTNRTFGKWVDCVRKCQLLFGLSSSEPLPLLGCLHSADFTVRIPFWLERLRFMLTVPFCWGPLLPFSLPFTCSDSSSWFFSVRPAQNI